MNLLPAFLIMLYLFKKSNVNFLEILPRLDIPSFTPIFKLLGFNDETIKFLSSDKFSEMLQNISDGNGDVKSFIPLFSAILKNSEHSAANASANPKNSNQAQKNAAEQENAFSCSAAFF